MEWYREGRGIHRLRGDNGALAVVRGTATHGWRFMLLRNGEWSKQTFPTGMDAKRAAEIALQTAET